mgnify:CR=1 FL=1
MNTSIKRNRNKLQIILVLTILFVLITTSLIKKGKVIVVEDKAHGIHREFYLQDNNFKLSYTHSVHKSLVEEYFTVTDDNKILLQKNVFDSFGVGAPYIENPDDLKIENGKFVLKMNRLFDEINMVISPIPKHKLTIGEKEIDIIDLLSEDTDSIKIYIIEKDVILFGNKYHII